MHVRDFKVRLDSLEKIEIEYDGPHGGLYTRYVRDIETLVQFFRSKAHEAGIGVRGLRITLEDNDEIKTITKESKNDTGNHSG